MPRGRRRGRNAIVRRRCEVHNCFIGVDGVCARCQESQIIQQEQDDVNSPNPPDASNDEEMRDEEMVVTEMCDKCCRVSTDHYKLDFQSIDKDSTHETIFGKHVTDFSEQTVKLCRQCVIYDNNTARHKDWPNAWPSVLYTLLFETHWFSSNAGKLYKILPHEIKESYKIHTNTVDPLIVRSVNDSVFGDITSEKKRTFVVD